MPAEDVTKGSPASAAADDSTKAPRHLPYGEQQGSFMGVVACSNRDDGFFSGENNYLSSGLIYTGYRYQCVEFARRFLLLTTGCLFGNCGRASEIFQMKHLTNVETGAEYPFIAHRNGKTKQKPQPGDIIIYPYHPEATPWGHVGVISYVDDKRIAIAEQNFVFDHFFSPDPDYLDGERCASRFVDLFQTEDGSWLLKETPSTGVEPLGWMTYPDAPRRSQIYSPLNPIPEQISMRSTPIDSEKHPRMYHIVLPEPVETLTGQVKSFYGLMNGLGESFVGSLTAISRIIRLTLQLLFRRGNLSNGFLGLLNNSLGAMCPVTGENAALDKLFSALREVLSDEEGKKSNLHAALADYFSIPKDCIAAMEREFSKGEFHLLGTHTFTFDLAKEIPRQDDGKGNFIPHILKSGSLHDEAWHLAQVNFMNPTICTEMCQLTEFKDKFEFPLNFIEGSYRIHCSTKFRMDFGAYLRTVESLRGSRKAFAIIKKPGAMCGTEAEMIRIFQDYCEYFRYPVVVIDEHDLVFDDASAKLIATKGVASPTTPSPPTDFEVNFAYVLEEWETILQKKECHKALYSAAIHPLSDVVFAKPLWSWLCTGLVNHVDASLPSTGNVCSKALPKATTSIKLFDLSRRLYELSMPKQPPDAWDMEVSEYKDSCRRIHLIEPVKFKPPCGFLGRGVVSNFAYSCITGGEAEFLTLPHDLTTIAPISLAALGFLFLKKDDD